MEIDLWRKIFSPKSTIGDMEINSLFECNTIEDFDRGLMSTMPLEYIKARKLYGVTCIPYGRYQIVIAKSQKRSLKSGKDVSVPFLIAVPAFTAIEIHPANFASELLGCIAPGIYDPSKPDAVWYSKVCYQKVFDKINDCQIKKEKVYINIRKRTLIT